MKNIDYNKILNNLFEYYRDETNHDEEIQKFINDITAWSSLGGMLYYEPANLYLGFSKLLEFTQTLVYRKDSSVDKSQLMSYIWEHLFDCTIPDYYNKNSKQSGNWWYWRIGIPNVLLKTLIMLKWYNINQGGLWDTEVIENIKGALNKFLVPNSRTDMTYANLASICRNIFVMGIIYEDEKLVNRGLDDAVPAFEQKSNAKIKCARALQKFYIKHPKLPYAISMFAGKEGIYDDYTFIQHTSIPYIGTYGLEIFEYAALIAKCGGELNSKITFMIPKWVFAAEIAIYDNQVLLPYCGRAVETVDTVNQARMLNKYINEIKANADVLFAPEYDEEEYAYVQPNADIAQFRTDKWNFVIKMSSDRTARYEAFNGQNYEGRNQGNGMTYLYIKGNDEYKNGYFKRVKNTEYPGICSNYSLLSGTDSQQPLFDYTKDEIDSLKAGGVNMDDKHALACMQTPKYNKVWFFNDNKIICVGDIKDPLYSDLTIVENRSVENKIYFKNTEGSLQEITDTTYFAGESKLYIEGVGGYIISGKVCVHFDNGRYVIEMENYFNNDYYTYTVYPCISKDEFLNLNADHYIDISEDCITYHEGNELVTYAANFAKGIATIAPAILETNPICYVSDFWQREGKVSVGGFQFNSKDLLGKTIKLKVKE